MLYNCPIGLLIKKRTDSVVSSVVSSVERSVEDSVKDYFQIK